MTERPSNSASQLSQVELSINQSHAGNNINVREKDYHKNLQVYIYPAERLSHLSEKSL